MPSSTSTGTPPRVTSWQPQVLHDAPLQVTEVSLPSFTVTSPDAPTLRAFEMSRSVGIPDDLLASETAAARASGYADGWAAGMAEARAVTQARLAADQTAAEQAAQQRDAQQQHAFHALFAAAVAYEARAVPAACDVEDQIVSTAWTIAAALIGQALADDDVRGAAAVKRALSLAPADDDVTVTVNHDDFAVLAGSDPAALAAHEIVEAREGRTVRIVPRESIAAGDAVAHSGATTIDASLGAAMERVRRVLGQ